MLIISYMLDANGIKDMAKLYIMMALLTLIGWAGVARMVRGQILFLREQEYMIATECTGLSVSKRIFKHLLPNVLPQLIVSMTLGLGSIGDPRIFGFRSSRGIRDLGQYDKRTYERSFLLGILSLSMGSRRYMYRSRRSGV